MYGTALLTVTLRGSIRMQDNSPIVAPATAQAKPMRVHPRMRVASGLYLITPDEVRTHALLDQVAPVLPAATWLQYRNKHAEAGLRMEQACALQAMCRTAGVAFIVNDDVELAMHCDADGVHLGEHDQDLRSARVRLGRERFIGVSCYDRLDRAHEAARDGADYVAFGAFQSSPTKPDARQAAWSLLREAAPLGLPVVAIGGIDLALAARAKSAGADLVAVISGVFGARDPVHAAHAYHAVLTQTTTRPS